MELIKLPNNIKKSLIQNSNNSKFPFTRGHARTILILKEPIKIQTLYNRIIREKLSVRKTEEIIKKINKNPQIKTSISIKKSLDLEPLLSRYLETRVVISNNKNNSGYMKISFKSKKDKDRIIDIIKSSKK